MNKWTWLVLLAIALLGGGYYLSSYQKSKEAAPVLPMGGKDPGGEDLDSGEDSGELDKDGSGFDSGDGQDPGPADDAGQGLGGSQEGSSAADTETFEDLDDPGAAAKDGANSREALTPPPPPNHPK